MDFDPFESLPMAELLRQTKTDVTHDHERGLSIAQYAYNKAEDPIDKGTAARQAMIRAAQSGASPEVVSDWLEKSREALSSDDPAIERERIAAELLNVRVQGIAIERLGSSAVALADARESAALAENILHVQHEKGGRWDRFGTMLGWIRGTFEAMNGDAKTAAGIALSGMWRALRAKNEGTPDPHLKFVVKQLGTNALALSLAATKRADAIPPLSRLRHKAALKMLT